MAKSIDRSNNTSGTKLGHIIDGWDDVNKSTQRNSHLKYLDDNINNDLKHLEPSNSDTAFVVYEFNTPT